MKKFLNYRVLPLVCALSISISFKSGGADTHAERVSAPLVCDGGNHDRLDHYHFSVLSLVVP